jgi:hypothetical protein
VESGALVLERRLSVGDTNRLDELLFQDTGDEEALRSFLEDIGWQETGHSMMAPDFNNIIAVVKWFNSAAYDNGVRPWRLKRLTRAPAATKGAIRCA